MSRGRNAEGLADEAARWRRSYREAQAVISEQNRTLLGLFLRERLADPSDFETYVDLATVVDRRGAVNWVRVDLLLEELLTAKPHLALTPDDVNPFQRGLSAVEWFTNGTR